MIFATLRVLSIPTPKLALSFFLLSLNPKHWLLNPGHWLTPKTESPLPRYSVFLRDGWAFSFLGQILSAPLTHVQWAQGFTFSFTSALILVWPLKTSSPPTDWAFPSRRSFCSFHSLLVCSSQPPSNHSSGLPLLLSFREHPCIPGSSIPGVVSPVLSKEGSLDPMETLLMQPCLLLVENLLPFLWQILFSPLPAVVLRGWHLFSLIQKSQKKNFAALWWEGAEKTEPGSSQRHKVTGQEVTRCSLRLGKFQIDLQGANFTTRLVKHWNRCPGILQTLHPQRC